MRPGKRCKWVNREPEPWCTHFSIIAIFINQANKIFEKIQSINKGLDIKLSVLLQFFFFFFLQDLQKAGYFQVSFVAFNIRQKGDQKFVDSQFEFSYFTNGLLWQRSPPAENNYSPQPILCRGSPATLKKQRFSDVFQGDRKKPVA